MRAWLIVLGVTAAIASAVAGWGYLQYGIAYDKASIGTLKGKLIVEWIDQDTFLFHPDETDPLVFTRGNKEVIQPGPMHTDGGSIPTALRALKSYSPWGYAPAFIVHDWLFVMKHCKLPGYEKLNLDGAASVMGEALKTMMESKKYGDPDKLVHYSMVQAVRSAAAQDYWDKGKCAEAQDKANKAEAQAKSARAVRAPSAAAPSASATPAPAVTAGKSGGRARYTIEVK